MSRDDEWLWDPSSGEPDEQTADLARRLGALRHRTRELEPPGARGRQSIRQAGGPRGLRLVSLLAAVLVLALLVSDVFDVWTGDTARQGGRASPGGVDGAPYVVEALAGRPTLRRNSAWLPGSHSEVLSGDLLVCDAASRADLLVEGAGRVRLEADTRLRVEQAQEGWRLHLERGRITASIFAAPRLFQLGTPSGIAVDLGCSYTATVDDAGRTTLSVSGGQVSFEVPGRKVFVPAGAEVVARPGWGPGTPVWEDASPEWRRAVEQLDDLAQGGRVPRAEPLPAEDRSALEVIGSPRRTRDSLTLWHLLEHPRPEVATVAGRALAALSPPPAGVSPEAVVAGDAAGRARWRERLEAGW